MNIFGVGDNKEVYGNFKKDHTQSGTLINTELLLKDNPDNKLMDLTLFIYKNLICLLILYKILKLNIGWYILDLLMVWNLIINLIKMYISNFLEDL